MKALHHLLWLALALPGAADARTWTDVDGRPVEADLIRHDETEVVFTLINGREAKFPLARLSPADLEYLKELADAPATAEKDTLNWSHPWPDSVSFSDDPEIEIIEENVDTESFIYASANYRFTCDVRLSKSVVGTFADLFEATRLFCRELPLGLTGGVKKDGKYDILLFETKEAYIRAGGPPTSSGVFIGGRNIVMVPLTSLGVRKVGSGYMRDRNKSDGTLVHELTHQLTPPIYYRRGSKGWFTEGLAEYLTATPYRSGRFNVRNNLGDIEKYLTAHGKDGSGGRVLGEEISAPYLTDFMLMKYDDFTGSNPNFNYGFALLLFTYFAHLDGDGDAARLKEFLKAVRNAPRRAAPTELLARLLDGRTVPELQDDIVSKWRGKGIKITFRESASGAGS